MHFKLSSLVLSLDFITSIFTTLCAEYKTTAGGPSTAGPGRLPDDVPICQLPAANSTATELEALRAPIHIYMQILHTPIKKPGYYWNISLLMLKIYSLLWPIMHRQQHSSEHNDTSTGRTFHRSSRKLSSSFSGPDRSSNSTGTIAPHHTYSF